MYSMFGKAVEGARVAVERGVDKVTEFGKSVGGRVGFWLMVVGAMASGCQNDATTDRVHGFSCVSDGKGSHLVIKEGDEDPDTLFMCINDGGGLTPALNHYSLYRDPDIQNGYRLYGQDFETFYYDTDIAYERFFGTLSFSGDTVIIGDTKFYEIPMKESSSDE